MAGLLYVDDSDLEEMYGPQQVRMMFANTGSGATGTRLARCLSVGCRRADQELLRAWSAEQIAALVNEDDAVKADVCALVMAAGEKGHPEWQARGEEMSPWEREAVSAMKRLKALADAQIRSVGEANGGGANPHLSSGKVSSGRSFVFAPSNASPRRGGF